MSSSKPRGSHGGTRKGPPSIDPKQHHLDWMGLVDVTGPFLTLPVLMRIWNPQLDALESAARRELREAHEDWQGQDRGVAGQGSWIAYVLSELLEWRDALRLDGESDEAFLAKLALDVPEHDTQVVPSFALAIPGTDDGVALIGLVLPNGCHPTQRIKGSSWAATPVDRLAQLCRQQGVELGLVTDGRWWALVWAPRGGVTSTAIFDAISWPELADRDVVRAFRSMLRRERFFSVPQEEQLPALLAESLKSGAEVTDELGRQVRQAVEMLVDAIGRADTRIDAQDAYRGAVAVMMRVLFLLYAEERGLLPAENEVYAAAYSASGLYRQLKDQADRTSESEIARSSAGWHRMVALFNAVYWGIEHPQLSMPAYDGSIFDPATYPWLAGLAVDDRTVLHMLGAVQFVELGTGKYKELRQLSFRALQVEQIGYVYEGLLSYEGLRATETVVGLIGKAGVEEEVPLAVLENLAKPFGAGAERDLTGLAEKLATTYKDSGIGSVRALEKALAPGTEAMRAAAVTRLRGVTSGDRDLADRLLPFAGLIRNDLRGDPVVILSGTVYVTESQLRKNTGAHYTPKFLAEQVVEGALEPLVFTPGPLQTGNRTQWKLRSSEDILNLKIADIAMGSAAFLVAACRYLARRLVDAWSAEDDAKAAAFLAGQSGTSDLVDDEADPVMVQARRLVIEHCLYGVDINPMAVEMAKLSLWLISMDPHRPFTFLDDRLVAGDSLLGITSLDQLETMHMDVERGRALNEDLLGWTSGVRALAVEIARERRALGAIEGKDLASLDEKRRLLRIVRDQTAQASLFADLVAGAALASNVKDEDIPWYQHEGRAEAKERSKERRYEEAAQTAAEVAEHRNVSDSGAWHQARQLADAWLAVDLPDGGSQRQPLHWPLAFPEVFENGGFDAIVGNPPFLGGLKIAEAHGTSYREYLVNVLGSGVRGTRGTGDLVAYFALRAHGLSHSRGQAGLIATNTLTQGDTRKVGLDQIIQSGTDIWKGVKSEPWPSRSATLEYCIVWTTKKSASEDVSPILDGRIVDGITSSLDPVSRAESRTERLAANQDRCFQGSNILGRGFLVPPDRASDWIAKDPRNVDVLFPYITGQDLNSRPDTSASQWVINFHDWPRSVAATYPAPYEQVERLVKPVRATNNQPSRRERWWQYSEYRRGLTQAIGGLSRTIVMARVSKTAIPVFLPTRQVFNEKTIVFAFDDAAMLAILSSAPHYWWAINRSSTRTGDLNYSNSDVFETFSLPPLVSPNLRLLGSRLDAERRDLILDRKAGLTSTYNLVHSPSNDDSDILNLREIHRLIDEEVFRAYGWGDLLAIGLGHDHHATRQGVRYTIAPAVQREVLDRLLEENHKRYSAEKQAGLHDKGAKKRATKKAVKPPVQEEGLF
ncbi:Eco57I restriction-modification methylase domain-containing protein [Kitasatospora purpeofusca]|uniref:Eco57I restriction-modification methylase domain-containing protein n=1 Tax=Kitasatospora purpeofusca TaxID=67352 RepID=UPI003863AE3E|nr:hypothetical protein OIP63_10055 [Kitasatospora purpeofusca]